MRNNTLDFAKLIASFFIIVVHTGTYPELGHQYGELFRVSSRWALLFFFLSSGYMAGLAKEFDVSKKINKLFSILVYSSIAYIPVLYLMNGKDWLKLILKIFSLDTLHVGTYFHLWFITALIFGVVATNYALKNCSEKKTLLVAILLLAGCWVADLSRSLMLIGSKETIFYALRTSIAFSLFYIGFLTAKKGILERISSILSLSVLVVSIFLMLAEVYFMHVLFGADMLERQVPLFSVLASLALLSLCVNFNIKNNFISGLGKNYSLGIYILHPFMLYFIIHDIGGEFATNSSLKLISCFSSSIIALMIIRKLTPYIYNKLNGIGVK